MEPGAAIEEPARPILVLECAGFTKWVYEPERRRPAYLYLLWRWDAPAGAWSEVARAWSPSWDWSQYLGPIAQRILQDLEPARLADLTAIERRIVDAIETELAAVDRRDRPAVLSIVHDTLAKRIVAAR